MAIDPDELARQLGGYVIEPQQEGEIDPDDLLAQELGGFVIQTAAPKAEEESFLRQVGDIPVQVGIGAATGVRFLTDAFGADNVVSQNIRGVEEYLQGLLSAQARQDQEEISRIMQEAEDKGVKEQVLAGLRAFTVAPVDFLAQAAGTALPTVAGGLAGAALRGGTMAARAATAAATGAGIGTVTGAGLIKSTIYDEVKRELTELGVSEEVAEERATLAQEYGGENLDMILAGAGLGALAAGTGIEKAIASRILGKVAAQKTAERGVVQRALIGGAKEAGPEFIQAAQEQTAANVALQREGFEDVPTFRGAVAAGTLEATAGFGLGAGIGGLSPAQQAEYDARRASITDEVSREREAELRVKEDTEAQEFIRQMEAEQTRRQEQGTDVSAFDTSAALVRDQADAIPLPTEEELAQNPFLPNASDDAKLGAIYGRKIATTLGEYFPTNAQFTASQEGVTEEGTYGPEGTAISLGTPTFVVRDSTGKQYGQPLQSFEQANGLAYSLNAEVVNQNVRNTILTNLDTAATSYTPQQSETLFRYGYQALHPEANQFSSVEINEAANTTGPQYAEALSFRQFEELPDAKDKKGKVIGKLYRDDSGKERVLKGMTKAQELNKQRVEEGKPQGNTFSFEETKSALGDNLSKLTRNIPIDLRDTTLSRPSVDFVRNYDAVTGRPITSLYKNAAANAISDLLKSKNISSEINSPEIKSMAKAVTGKSSVKSMDYGEARYFFKKLAALPRFDTQTKLPEFSFKPYNRENFVRVSRFVQDANARGIDYNDDVLAEAAGISKEDPELNTKLDAIKTDLSQQGVPVTPPPRLALPAPVVPQESLDGLRESLRKQLTQFGLNDVGLRLERSLVLPSGEVAQQKTQAFFDPNLRQVFLAVDRVDPDGSLTPDQRLNALSELMGHELLHATRNLDLWKDSEWRTLENTASRLVKPGTERTYLDIAKTDYADQSQVIQMEEAVADMFRDYTAKRIKVAGKPQSMLERLKQFFNRLKSAIKGTGFQTFEDVIRAYESGQVGARQRGEVRTLRATEEALGEAGVLPERLRPLFATPQARIEKREEVLDKLEKSNPEETVKVKGTDFRLQDLENAAIREARTSIYDVPKTIDVDGVRRSTRDSEGRLIYAGREGEEEFGIRTAPTMTGLENFWKWFGDSQMVDKEGRPLVFYHGTARDVEEFIAKQAGAVFLTRSPEFAKQFSRSSENYMVSNFTQFLSDEEILQVIEDVMTRPRLDIQFKQMITPVMEALRSSVAAGVALDNVNLQKLKVVSLMPYASALREAVKNRLPTRANVLPVYANPKKTWDYTNKEDVKQVVKRAKELSAVPISATQIEEVKAGNWETIEGSSPGGSAFLAAIRDLGYDSMFVEEQGEKNLAVFDPSAIKSAVGNDGRFSPSTRRIREARDVQVRMPRIPGVLEDAPILPIGNVEQSLIDLFKKTNAPTSTELSEISGAPTKRTVRGPNNEPLPDPRDTEVSPTSMAELRRMAEFGLRNSEDLRWYEQFGRGFIDIVGAANLGEAAVIFGITSQQNSAEQNLADTLHIMRLAREFDPVSRRAEFENAVRTIPRPGGQRLKITGDQINRIIRMYQQGFAEAGLKTSTYMQLIQDRAANRFNPFSVQDVHMARVFGFRRKEVDPKSGNLVDGSKIPGDLQYRYAQFLTSKLAEEFGVSPDRMQAALWFYAKTNLSPREKGGKPGTWPSARANSAKEIQYIQDMVDRGQFDKNNALTPALRAGIRPSNAVKTVTAPYSNTQQAEQLLDLARRRAPLALVSATPGNARGYGFPAGTPFEKVVEFNRKAIKAITDDDGQIPFLRELGIPHEIELSFGTYGELEPNIQVKLLGGTPQQAKVVANILGDALLQDAAIFGQPTTNEDRVNNFGITVMKADGSNFTVEELSSISNAVNPTKATDDGINFTLIQPNVLSFLDSRSFGDDYQFDTMLPEFSGKIQELLPKDISFEVAGYTQEGDYFGSEDYKSRIQEAWDSNGLGGSPDIFKRIDDTLYKPFWRTYSDFRKSNRLGSSGSARPAPFKPAPRRVREARRPPGQLDRAYVDAAESIAETPSIGIPLYNLAASPEALFVAQNPDQGIPLEPAMRRRFARNNEPQPSEEAKQVMDRLVAPPPSETPTETLLRQLKLPPLRNWIDGFRQEAIFNYSRLEYYNQNHPSLKQNMADTSSLAAAEWADRSKALTAAAITEGVIVYEEGGFRVRPFIHNDRQYKGLIEVMRPLYDNPYGSIEKYAQSYAIARRGKRLDKEGKEIPGGPEDLAIMEKEIERFVDPATNKNIIKEWYDAWQAYNSYTIKFLRDTGMVDEEGANIWLNQSDYVPFYRVAKNGKDISNPKVFGGLTSVTNLKALRGSTEQINVPLLDAIASNLDSAIAMGMKNVAQQRIVRDMITIGLGRMVRIGEDAEGIPTVTFKIQGKKYRAVIEDPLIFESMQAIPEMGLDNILGSVFTTPATALRELIVRAPDYMIANMLRDTGSVVLTSGANIVPVVDTVRNFANGLNNLRQFGVVGGYDFARDPKEIVTYMADEARRRGHEIPVEYKSKFQRVSHSPYMRPMKAAWDALGNISDRAEAATRNAVYEDTLQRTGNWVESAYQALSVINYGRRGRNAGVRVLTAVVPFLNARIQGLDKLYQAGTGQVGAFQDRKKNFLRFLFRAGLMVGLTGLYYAMMSDDEMYENENQEVKDNYYFLPVRRSNIEAGDPGLYFKIPIPFEVGILFKVIPERILDSIHGQTTSRDLQQSMLRAVTGTLAFNPVPQAVLPLAEAAVNYDSFTGRPVVPQYLTDKGPIAQARFGTNELARQIGEATNTSPLKLEHVMSGYLGSLGTYTLDAVDSAMRSADRAYPQRNIYEYPLLRRFFAGSVRPGLQSQFYDLKDQVDRVNSEINALQEQGRVDELQAYMISHQNIIALKSGVNALNRQLRSYREQKEAILRSEMDPAEKRALVDQLDRQMAMALRVIPELRRAAFDEERQTGQ